MDIGIEPDTPLDNYIENRVKQTRDIRPQSTTNERLSMDNETGVPETPPPADGWCYNTEADGFSYALYNATVIIARETLTGMAHRLNLVISDRNSLRDSATAQISGDDHRLTDFWAKALELADAAGHCDIFDQIAGALGGPQRTRSYTVTLPIQGSIDIEVEASSPEAAIDEARDVYNYGSSIDFGDIENVDTDWYSAEAELS